MTDLDYQHQKFVIEYMACWNATQAAIASGYSERTAYSQGSRLLKNAEIQAELQRRLDEHAMSANEVLFHLANIARTDFGELIDENGNPDIRNAKKLRKTGLIKRLKNKTITTTDAEGHGTDIFEVEVEVYDRLKALELLAKYHDLINKVRIEDWRSEVIGLLRDGKVTPAQVEAELGVSLAQELFNEVGLQLLTSGESSET